MRQSALDEILVERAATCSRVAWEAVCTAPAPRGRKPSAEVLEEGRAAVNEMLDPVVDRVRYDNTAYQDECAALEADATPLVEATRDALRRAVELLCLADDGSQPHRTAAALADADDARMFADEGARRCIICSVAQPVAAFIPRPGVSFGGGYTRRCRSCTRDLLLKRGGE